MKCVYSNVCSSPCIIHCRYMCDVDPMLIPDHPCEHLPMDYCNKNPQGASKYLCNKRIKKGMLYDV